MGKMRPRQVVLAVLKNTRTRQSQGPAKPNAVRMAIFRTVSFVRLNRYVKKIQANAQKQKTKGKGQRT